MHMLEKKKIGGKAPTAYSDVGTYMHLFFFLLKKNKKNAYA